MRNGARYLEKKMAIAEFINPNTKDQRPAWTKCSTVVNVINMQIDFFFVICQL